MRNTWLYFFTGLLVLVTLNWFTDVITLEGHWTMYTARCEGGTWQERRCTGRLVAAERHRFVANKAKAEVAFEAIGPSTSSGTLSGCTIEDGRNWACPTATPGSRPSTRMLVRGNPVGPLDCPGNARLVSKWKWTILRLGLPAGLEVQA